MLEMILLLTACHFIGDFPFQSEWFVTCKGKSWEVNFYHAAVYTCTFIIFAKISWAFALLLLISHFIIDPLKARWGIVKTVWADQILHFLIIAAGIYFKL